MELDVTKTKVCKVCGQEKPISDFHVNKYGITSTCKDCARKKRRDNLALKKDLAEFLHEQDIEAARQAQLENFTPEELLAQLKRWGYHLKGTKTEVIDTDKIEI